MGDNVVNAQNNEQVKNLQKALEDKKQQLIKQAHICLQLDLDHAQAKYNSTVQQIEFDYQNSKEDCKELVYYEARQTKKQIKEQLDNLEEKAGASQLQLINEIRELLQQIKIPGVKKNKQFVQGSLNVKVEQSQIQTDIQAIKNEIEAQNQ